MFAFENRPRTILEKARTNILNLNNSIFITALGTATKESASPAERIGGIAMMVGQAHLWFTPVVIEIGLREKM
ncbi:hypothetical protein [Candidatus Endomicrobiellum agilis]|uniref:hypothetical protein n=1 Tax=Candidatus Endomicrobiellum agilis TaxID=3238957 RepID=UPI003575BF2A|nr:hypothetical protein [Endomicrobium sp.]